MQSSYRFDMSPFMSRLPEPSQPNMCSGSGRAPPYRLHGSREDAAVAGELVERLQQERDEARTWARALWPVTQPQWRARLETPGPVPDWLAVPPD